MVGAHQVYLGLGSNLGDRRSNLERAISLLEEGEVRIDQISAFQLTDPVGGPEQDPFLNGVLRVSTSLEPLALLHLIHRVEEVLGRVRGGVRWGPRTIDIDILLYDDLDLDTEGLVIPHPRMGLRSFVLEPLVEVLA